MKDQIRYGALFWMILWSSRISWAPSHQSYLKISAMHGDCSLPLISPCFGIDSFDLLLFEMEWTPNMEWSSLIMFFCCEFAFFNSSFLFWIHLMKSIYFEILYKPISFELARKNRILRRVRNIGKLIIYSKRCVLIH